MAKIVIAGDAVVVKSELKLEDIKTIEKYNAKALTLTGGIFDFKLRESGFKALELRFNLRGVHTALFNVGKIFLA